MENIKDFLNSIEEDLDSIDDNILYLELKKTIKYFLASEYYYKKIAKKSNENTKSDIDALYEFYYNYYHKEMKIYDSRYIHRYHRGLGLDEISIQDYHYMFTYNTTSIKSAEKLKNNLELIFESKLLNNYTFNTNMINKDYIANVFEIHKKDLLSKFKKQNTDECFDYFQKLIESERLEVEELSFIMNNPQLIKYIIKNTITKINDFIELRQSYTRGMEAGCPIPYIKGTICTISFGIVLINDFISWLKRKDYDYCHVSIDGVEEKKPGVSCIDESARNFLLTVGSFSGIVWFNGCKPLNY